MTPRALGPRPRPAAAFAAVYSGQLSRARAARVPLLFVAAFQSLGILLLLRGTVDASSSLTTSSVVAGCTVLVIAFVALNLLAQRIGALRASGGLDYYAALPVPPAIVITATAASFASFAVPGTVVTAVVGALLYGLPLGGLWLLVPVTVLAGAALAGVGALIGLLAPRPELATVLGQLGMTAALFAGIEPASRLPGPLRAARALVPSTYGVDALAAGFRSPLRFGSVLGDLAVSAAVAVLSLLLATRAWRYAVSR